MEIIERIKKLHALAERNSSTEEAASAAAKIQELCFKHNLELEEILKTSGQQKSPYVKFDYLMPDTTRADVGWKRTLFGGICKSNFCSTVYFPNSTKMAVVGQKHNFEAVCYTFEYLTREIQRLGIEHIRQGGFFGKEKRRYFQGFCEGAANAVYWKLANSLKQQAAQTTESKALVVVKDKELDAAVRIHFGKTRKVSRRATGNSSGYSDGTKAGQNINVNRGVGSSSRTLIG